MKHIKFILIIIICLFTNVVISQSVKLSFKPVKGSQYLETLNFIQDGKTKIEGFDQEQKMKNEVSVYVTSELLGKNDRNNFLLKQKITRMTMDMQMMGTTLSVDTDNVDEATPMESNVLNGITPLIDKELIREISKDGKVLGYDFNEELKETFDKYTSSINDKSYGVLPNKKVKINDTWDFETETESSNGLVMISNFKYQLIVIDGHQAKVTITGTIKQKKQNKEADNDDNPVQNLSLKDGSLQGTGTIDIKTGIYMNMEINMKMDMSMRVNDMDATTSLDQKMIRTVKKI